MNQQQAQGIMDILVSAFPQKPVSTETLMIYQRCIMDLDFESAKAAVLDLVTTEDWLPSIAAIRKASLSLTHQLPTAGEAWAEVLDVARDGGFRRGESFKKIYVAGQADALADGEICADLNVTAGRLLDRAVAAMGGWSSICMSENEMADRAHFMKIWEALAAKAQKETVRLPEARQLEAKALMRLAAPQAKQLEGR